MLRLLQYYGKYQSARGVLGDMPGWARLILLIVALPGIAGLLLSVLAICVSLAALLLLTVPVYRLLNAVTGGGNRVTRREDSSFVAADFIEPQDAGEPDNQPGPIPTVVVENPTGGSEPQRPRRQIDVRIVE